MLESAAVGAVAVGLAVVHVAEPAVVVFVEVKSVFAVVIVVAVKLEAME